MKIIFGLHLDGQRTWQRRNLFGHATVGPLGLLTLLETFLGLPASLETEGERILQYRELLAKHNTSERFYQRSFEANQYAVARTLLGWRDMWYLHGWDGKFGPTAPPRLRDMAAIEAHVAGQLAPCFGERLVAIAAALSQRQHPIEQIEISDPLEVFPLSWQKVLQRLPCKQLEASQPASNSSNLARLQNRLLHTQGEALLWNQEDDSIIVFQSHSRIAAAKLIAELVHQDAQHTLILAEAEGALLDALSGAHGNACQGISEKSNSRPPLQLLSLAFSLIWKPLDVFALLEFLTHPMNPFPEYVRNKLAEAVAAQPGMGGEKWCAAIEEIKRIAGDRADEVMVILGQWLQPPVITAGESTSVATLVEIANRVSATFSSRLRSDDLFTLHANHSGNMQCARIIAVLRLLEKQGIQQISRLELDQMLEQINRNGESSAANPPEVGITLLATHPAAVREAVDTVIWWNMAAPDLPASYPWYNHEIDAMREVGILLPDMDSVLESEAKYWQRPVLATRKQLILMLPPEGEEVHPIWLSIERAFAGSKIPVHAVEDVLENKLAILSALPVQLRPLPQRRRWWQFEPGQIPTQKRHSFSSLDKFLNKPFEWVLRYPAQIKLPNILSLAEGNLLLGSLAHRCAELLYAHADALEWTPEQVVSWVEGHLQQLLEAEGAVLLLPGRSAILEAFRQKLRTAIRELHTHLQTAEVVSVESEKQISGDLFMGELNGFIDILATRRDQTAAVIDMKWNRGKGYRERLQNNRHLQLAIYGEMLRQKTGRWAVPAYFILEESNLYTQDANFFPKANVVRTKEDGGSALLWQQALETLRWRQKQLAEGRVELVINGTEADEHSVWPDGALEIDPAPRWRSNYVWLTGWGDEA